MEERPIKVNPVVALAILIQVIFVILIIVTLSKLNTGDEGVLEVEVSGLVGEIDNLPEFGKKDIEYGIYNAISENTDSSIIQKKGIYIREGSLINNYYEDFNMHYVNFIADIPEIGQSYQVVSRWYDSEDVYMPDIATGVSCLDSVQLIYGDFECKDYLGYMKYVIVDSLLDIERVAIGDDIILTSEYQGDDMEGYRIKIEKLDCETQCYCQVASEEVKKTASESLENFVEGIGFGPKDIAYYFYDCSDEKLWADENGDYHLREN